MRTLRLALSLVSFGLVACHHHGHGSDSDGGTPVFVEQERNDDPLTANHFGVLRPGDHFIIEGNVRDDLVDPFDGFAFTAGGPLHVDFQLFIHNAAADLDVTLYDPQIDQTVASFATSDNPEVGGVDVLAGGLDFHLVVESFSGDATYSLEISVLSLFLRDGARAEGAPAIVASGARAERATAAATDYARRSRQPRLEIEQLFDFDPASGILIERVRVRGDS